MERYIKSKERISTAKTAAISQLKFSKVIPLVPENYVDNQFIKDREEMRKLTPDKVFLDINKHLND